MPEVRQPSLPAAPKRQTDITPVSPLIGDLLLFEIEDCTRIVPDLPAYGTAHPKLKTDGSGDKKYPNHKLVLIRPVPNAREGIFEYVYAADRATQDLYNYEFSQADIGGVKFDAVRRDYLTARADFDPDVPAPGAAMADVPVGMFTAASSFVLVEKQQVRTDRELDSLYVAERRTYAKKVTTTNIGVDSLNGKPLYSTVTLFHKDELVSGSSTAATLFADTDNAYWGLQDNGTTRTGQQLSAHWYAVVTELIVGGAYDAGTKIIAVSEHTTNENYYWPPVCTSLGTRSWARHDGGTDIQSDYVMNPEGYRGPCAATVVRTWKKDPQTVPQVGVMLPERVQYASPGFTVNIPDCLHDVVSLICDYGSGDPVYKQNVGSQKTFPATSPTTWPSEIVASDDQVPFRGGYLRTVVTVAQPVGLALP